MRTVSREAEFGTAQRRDRLERRWLMNDRASCLAKPDSKAQERDGAGCARCLGNRHVVEWRGGLADCPAKTTDDDHDRLSFSVHRRPLTRQGKSLLMKNNMMRGEKAL